MVQIVGSMALDLQTDKDKPLIDFHADTLHDTTSARYVYVYTSVDAILFSCIKEVDMDMDMEMGAMGVFDPIDAVGRGK